MRLWNHSLCAAVQAAAPASSMLFSAGMSRPEVLVRSARILESLAATKQAGGAPQDAFSIRLLTIQVGYHWQKQNTNLTKERH